MRGSRTSQRTRRRLALAGLAIVLLAVAGFAPGTARAATWCGTTATANRPAVQTGRPIRVLYAVPSDGEDRSAQLAAQISSDVDDIGAWWRSQDPTREPRFDRTSFACGLQVDLTVVRLPDAGAQLLGDPGIERIFRETMETSRQSIFQSYVVYYDGPVAESRLCGVAYGASGGPGQAIVFLRACEGVPSETTAAHELLHTLGAVPDAGPSHICPQSSGHVCDSESDIMYPYASGATLSSFVLDVGRDDYYGHTGAWPDAQDSLWLRHLDAQAHLTLGIKGAGNVVSDVPGIDCDASCATDWDPGSSVVLDPTPGLGQRFIGWTGACSGSGSCKVVLDSAKSVGAVFARLAYRLTLTVKGKGAIVLPSGVGCKTRCATSQTSYEAVVLKPKAAKGWRFVSWSGACRGTTRCRVPMTADTRVGAVFKKK